MTDPIRAIFAEEDQQLIDFLGRYMISKARAALAKAEPGPTSKASLQVGPPAEGEVMEVLADLRYSAHRYRDRGFFDDARRCTRAADLIERLVSPLPGGEAKT